MPPPRGGFPCDFHADYNCAINEAARGRVRLLVTGDRAMCPKRYGEHNLAAPEFAGLAAFIGRTDPRDAWEEYHVATPAELGAVYAGEALCRYAAEFVGVVKQLAAANNLPMIDMTTRWTSYAYTNPVMAYHDPFHPGALGYSDFELAVFGVVSGQQFNYVLERDLGAPANDNRPAFGDESRQAA